MNHWSRQSSPEPAKEPNREPSRPPGGGRATQAAEGLARWRWTVAEVERMADAGLFADDDRVELIGGELVPMSPKGRRHEIVRSRLAYVVTRLVPDHVFVASEGQLNLDESAFVVPDLLCFPASLHLPDVRGPDVLLAVEVADTSVDFDLGRKAALYALHGVRQYWVVNATSLVTTVFTEPAADGYASRRDVAPHVRLEATFAAAIRVRLDDVLA